MPRIDRLLKPNKNKNLIKLVVAFHYCFNVYYFSEQTKIGSN